MLGYATSKVQAFDHLRREDSSPENDVDEKDAAGSEADERVRHDSPLSSHSDDGFLSSKPSHLELNTPVIRLPAFSQSLSSGDVQEIQETLIPVETDEELLNQELAEENALDQQDQALEKIYQDELWASYKHHKAILQQS